MIKTLSSDWIVVLMSCRIAGMSHNELSYNICIIYIYILSKNFMCFECLSVGNLRKFIYKLYCLCIFI